MNKRCKNYFLRAILAVLLAGFTLNAVAVQPTKKGGDAPIDNPANLIKWLKNNNIKAAIFIDDKGQAIVSQFDGNKVTEVSQCGTDASDPNCKPGGTNTNSYSVLLRVFEPPVAAAPLQGQTLAKDPCMGINWGGVYYNWCW